MTNHSWSAVPGINTKKATLKTQIILSFKERSSLANGSSAVDSTIEQHVLDTNKGKQMS